MRQRRAGRCLVRASAALDAEVPEIARELLAEARALDPYNPELQEVEARLLAASDRVVTAPVLDRRRPEGLLPRDLFLLLVVAVALSWVAASIDAADVRTLLKHLLTTAGSGTIYLSPSA